LIDPASVSTIQTRAGGGVIIRTRDGGVFTVSATLSDVAQWHEASTEVKA
jgi:hypothetical protein